MLPTLLVLLCVVLRVVPHPPNFAPIGATAVFAGRSMPLAQAIVLVVLAMLASDAALARLNGYPIFDAVTPFVYGGFCFQALLGRWLRARRGGALGAALLGATGFFTISNLGVWVASGMYPHSFAGLTACYTAALPFFGATVAGDLIWTAILCGGYGFAARRWDQDRFWIPVRASELGTL